MRVSIPTSLLLMACGGGSGDGPDAAAKLGWTLATLHQDGAVYAIDPETAELSLLAELDLSAAGETFNPPSADVRHDGLGILACNKPEPVLFEFDVCAGTAELIGPTAAGATGALGFGPFDALYLLDQEEDLLRTVELTTGRAVRVGRLGFDLGFAGLAYDPEEDRLLGIDADGPAVFEVKPRSARTTHLADLPHGDWRAVGVEYDASRHVLWVSDGPSLWELDPDSGAMTKVGDYGELTYINDLTLIPPCD